MHDERSSYLLKNIAHSV